IAAPIPLLPPVPMATLPSSDSGAEEDLDVGVWPRRELGKGAGARIERKALFQLTEASPPLREQVEGALEVRVLVGEHPSDGVVAADHLAPWQNSLVTVHADEHGGAGGTQQVHGEETSGLRACSIDDHVDSGPYLLRVPKSLMRAEAKGVISPRRMALDDRDLLNSAEQCRLHTRQANRSGADDNSARSPLGRALADGADSIGEGLDKSAQTSGHAGGQLGQASRRHGYVAGEPTWHRHPDKPAIRALIATPTRAIRAFSAADDRIDRHSLAQPRLVDAFADCFDRTGELVAHDQRRHAVRHHSEVAFDLGPADPSSLAAHYDLALIGARLRQLFNRHPTWCLPDQGFHDSHYGSPRFFAGEGIIRMGQA